MQVMLAASLPMLRAALDDLDRNPTGVDDFLIAVISVAAELRADDAPGLRIRSGNLTVDTPGEPAGLAG